MGVGAEDHFAGGGVPLPHIGVDDGLVGGDEFAAVFLGGGQAEHVVVLVDGAAHGAQGVVAVGEHIGQRKFGHARGPGGLDDAHVGDVVGGHGVEGDAEPTRSGVHIVGRQNGRGNGLGRRPRAGGEGAFYILHRLTVDSEHGNTSLGVGDLL